MGDIINLRKARKATARREAEQQAQENRMIFGRSKAQKRAEKDQIERDNRHLDGASLVVNKNDGIA